jgi:hypothetical protein
MSKYTVLDSSLRIHDDMKPIKANGSIVIYCSTFNGPIYFITPLGRLFITPPYFDTPQSYVKIKKIFDSKLSDTHLPSYNLDTLDLILVNGGDLPLAYKMLDPICGEDIQKVWNLVKPRIRN